MGDILSKEQRSVLMAKVRSPDTKPEWILRCATRDAWQFGCVRKWNPDILISSMRIVHTDIFWQRFDQTKEGEREPISRFFKVPRNVVCNTFRPGTGSATKDALSLELPNAA